MEISESKSGRKKQTKRLICTPSPNAKNAFFYIQEAGCMRTSDTSAAQHENLDTLLFAAVSEGQGELSYGGETYSLSKGDCFFIDCRAPHYYKCSGRAPWELMWIHFSGSTSHQYYETFIAQSRNVFTPASFDKVIAALSGIVAVNEENAPDAEIITSKLIVELLTEALVSGIQEKQYDTALRQKLSAIHRYVSENFREDISLERLSSEFYISKFYLTREYKKIYGMTIFQHLINARINHGKQLLRFSDRSVEEIAHLCGFNDQSYFARQFKKSENITCFAYRKKWRD